jgi:ABC-type glycerol-3-phosphate transport system substrate-binding protein
VVGETAQFFPFPSIEGSPPAVIGGGDVAVLFNDSEAAAQLIRYLATPQAANVWVELGGFTTPNQGIDASLYPSELLRQTGQQLQQAEVFRFDMSDLQPSEFGGTTGQGLFGALQEFVRNPDPQATAEALEQDAAEAFGN